MISIFGVCELHSKGLTRKGAVLFAMGSRFVGHGLCTGLGLTFCWPWAVHRSWSWLGLLYWSWPMHGSWAYTLLAMGHAWVMAWIIFAMGSGRSWASTMFAMGSGQSWA